MTKPDEIAVDMEHSDEAQLRKLLASMEDDHPAKGLMKALTDNPELVVPALSMMVSTLVMGLASTQQKLDHLEAQTKVGLMLLMKGQPKAQEPTIPSAGNAVRYGTVSDNGGYV